MAARKATRKAAAKRPAATPSAADRQRAGSPADAAVPPASAGVPLLSVGKTYRLQAARLCPGGEPVDKFGSSGDGCGRCPSVAECHVARFNPKAT